ncbi:putative RDD family membrane protein YckC [Phycicoccus badiiscoriae]|uniref:Putative RDD family membrane protein YckC n=1 Tax=Pedococcus badiiscoriae TaxID=642776 RepID=A0A852WEJ5_9MICO|nr:RDD family protein [Pedococcus badiiscoriae]NYG07170.1 putative RDD family membrane protein YckC [Pedococcus badiiscoriae]
MAEQPNQPTAPQPNPPQPSAPQPFAAPAYGAPIGYAVPTAYGVGGPWGPLAGWGTRVAAYLIDGLLQLIGMIPYVIGITLFVAAATKTPSYDSTYPGAAPVETGGDPALMAAGGLLCVLGLLLMLGIAIWNRAFKQGRTGQSIGKKAMGIMLLDENTGRPIGAGMAFVRDLAHTLDGFFYLGYLWPLWDDKRQTFADKILSTVVVETPKG